MMHPSIPSNVPRTVKALGCPFKNQFSGNNKWESEIHRHKQLIHTHMWKGKRNFTPERFIAKHHNSLIYMQDMVDHVTHQLPNKHIRVRYLLDAIQNSNAGLQGDMASAKIDNDMGGLRNNFKSAAAHLLNYDPVQKKQSNNNKRGAA